jgi:endonuclease YncB( thermonuclease family)
VLQRIRGKVRVLDATTVKFVDGTRIDLNITAPDMKQMGRIGDELYPCGKEAAEHLRRLIGESPVAAFRYADDSGPWWVYAGDTYLRHAMILGGWALADHSSNQAAEAIARENRRGLWRGTFVHPDEWRRGKRLPGE